jgi:TfoX/Sxy family transcriptional regulator of competence genes
MAKPAKGSMPKADPETRAAFQELLPDDPAVTLRPMFGNLSAFVNGNMFAGVFGGDLFVRLPDARRAAAVDQGATEFTPMPGRTMKGYVTLPGGWRDKPDRATAWIEESLAWARELPPKTKR